MEPKKETTILVELYNGIRKKITWTEYMRHYEVVRAIFF